MEMEEVGMVVVVARGRRREQRMDGRMIPLNRAREAVGGARVAAASWRITPRRGGKHTQRRARETTSLCHSLIFLLALKHKRDSLARTQFPVSALNAGPDQRCVVFTFHLAVAVKRAGCSVPGGRTRERPGSQWRAATHGNTSCS